MPVPSSQGLSATFGSASLGQIIGFQTQFAAGSAYDFTSVASSVAGAGANTRVLRQLNPTMIEPGSCTLKFLGYTALGKSDCGRIATLTISQGSLFSASFEAYVADVQLEGNRGELIQSSVQFQFTGS
jgi:hypothetical protein